MNKAEQLAEKIKFGPANGLEPFHRRKRQKTSALVEETVALGLDPQNKKYRIKGENSLKKSKREKWQSDQVRPAEDLSPDINPAESVGELVAPKR